MSSLLIILWKDFEKIAISTSYYIETMFSKYLSYYIHLRGLTVNNELMKFYSILLLSFNLISTTSRSIIHLILWREFYFTETFNFFEIIDQTLYPTFCKSFIKRTLYDRWNLSNAIWKIANTPELRLFLDIRDHIA